MSKFSILWFAFVCFLSGVGLSLWQSPLGASIKRSFGDTPLIVLIPADSIPEDLVESYSIEAQSEVSFVYYQNQYDFQTLVAQGNYDVVLAQDHQILSLSRAGKLARLNMAHIGNAKLISADFMDRRDELAENMAIPLFWGVKTEPAARPPHESFGVRMDRLPSSNIGAQFIQGIAPVVFGPQRRLGSVPASNAKTSLWVDSLAISADSKSYESGMAFINYLLEPEVALEMTRVTSLASTNLSTESQAIDSTLKPSHLRKHSLARLVRERSH